MTMVVPRMAVFVAVGVDTAAPVAPVAPELPDVATGFETALDVAFPVWPLLVALDWALVEPELPVDAVGLTRTVDPPPLPPLALPTATLEPPTAVEASVGGATTFTAAPPDPATGAATPPLPPLPPAATAATVLLALPVEPDVEVEFAPAPEFAELTAVPTAVAAPVLPELPELPDVAWAPAACAPRRSMKKAANAPPRSIPTHGSRRLPRCSSPAGNGQPYCWSRFRSTITVRFPSRYRAATATLSQTIPSCISPSPSMTNVWPRSPRIRQPSAIPAPMASP